jgi:hypothetical protein
MPRSSVLRLNDTQLCVCVYRLLYTTFFCICNSVFTTPFIEETVLSLFCILCWKSSKHKWMNLFLGSLFCSTGLCLLSKYYAVFIIIAFFWEGITLWTQVFTLAKQAFYCLNHTSSPFYFGDGISQTNCLGWPQTAILPICFPSSQDYRNKPPGPGLITTAL